ncbi:uncharacterized protein [Rutidosis leptorrhynchoides]|uniref:uncharacterized protein n=1 Tax=Rutidosis leptorrhynchoides TaxID=125765 RepID=UPI003A9A5606
MGRTDILSQALQKKSQDIVNAIKLVSATKKSLIDFRNDGWDSLFVLFEKVKLFSKKHQIDIPDMNSLYKSTRYLPRRQDNQITIEHHYHTDLFIGTVDKQLQELDNKFNEHDMDLLTLGSSLLLKKDNEMLDIDNICLLVEKYYPANFTEQEMDQLRYQFEFFIIEMPNNPKLKAIPSIARLCTNFVETNKLQLYYLADRLIRLILTLPVSTTTTERGFSAKKIFKNRLRNKMSDDFLASNLVMYIEK